MQGKDFGKFIRSITGNVNSYIGLNIEKYGIKQGQFEYFLLIFSTPGINQLELARLKNVGKASVTKALKILEDEGFVRRETSEYDKRKIHCYITDKGMRIVDDLMDVKKKAEKALFKDFKDEEIEAFYKYLVLLDKNAKALMVGVGSVNEKY
jgi:DNA-binding MarR family transcriptional regulator